MPALFALTWVGFLLWVLARADAPPQLNGAITAERAALVVLGAAVGWLIRLVSDVRSATPWSSHQPATAGSGAGPARTPPPRGGSTRERAAGGGAPTTDDAALPRRAMKE